MLWDESKDMIHEVLLHPTTDSHSKPVGGHFNLAVPHHKGRQFILIGGYWSGSL